MVVDSITNVLPRLVENEFPSEKLGVVVNEVFKPGVVVVEQYSAARVDKPPVVWLKSRSVGKHLVCDGSQLGWTDCGDVQKFNLKEGVKREVVVEGNVRLALEEVGGQRDGALVVGMNDPNNKDKQILLRFIKFK